MASQQEIDHAMPPSGHPNALSKLTIGTVQFGVHYGLANRTGVPAFSEICALLEEAAAAGINTLDTAASYGNSEETLGQALRETGLRDAFTVVTKAAQNLSPKLSRQEAAQEIRLSIERSLQRLQMDRLPMVLLHGDTVPEHFEALSACQEAGLVERCGVSFLDVRNIHNFLSLPSFSAMQAPMNALDRRFSYAARATKDRSGLVFTRSTYLQGLLLMSDEATPKHLAGVKSDRDFLNNLAAELEISTFALLLRAMLECDQIDSVVVGVETKEQLRSNIAVLLGGNLPAYARAKLENYRPASPGWMLDPFRWPEHAQAQPPDPPKIDGVPSLSHK